MPRFTRPTRRILAALPATGLALTMLAACGGGGAASADTQQTAANGNTPASTGNGSTTTPGGIGTNRGSGARTGPGASGKIAEISGSTMQVQSTSAQTAVSWTKDTTFTDTVSAKSSDLAVGDCISVSPAFTDTTTTTDETVPVAASSISISDGVSGACGFGGGGFGGAGGGFPGGQLPNGGQVPNGGQLPDGAQAPNGGQAPPGGQRPDGARQGDGGGFRGGVSGKVVSIDGGTITVEMTRPAMPNGTATAAPKSGTTTTSSRTVTFSSATTWTQTESTDSDALEVGRCVTALGTAGSTGAVTANSIVIRSSTNGECTGGLAGRPSLGRGQVGAPASTQAGA